MALSITFLGHAGFLLDDGEHKLAIDPFLTGNPLAVHKPEDLDVQHIALTHGHADHFGDTLPIAQRTGAEVIAAFEICNYLNEQGHESVNPGNPGGHVATAFGAVHFTHAFHSSSYEGRYMGMPCGLVIEMGGFRFYHCGDTGLFGDMKMIGEMYAPDIAAIPIGDRFTMGPELASRAAGIIGAGYVIPVHYNTWPPIEQDPATMQVPAGIEVKVMQPGEAWSV